MHQIRAALASILLCYAALVVAGCGGTDPTRGQLIERSSDELREAVSTKVADAGRRAQMLRTVDRIEAVNVRFSQETAQFIAAFRRLNADYVAPRPVFDQLFADYARQRMEARGEALSLHYELVSQATEVEWPTIGKAESRLYERSVTARPSPAGAP